jgi:hypothetical protein
MDWFHNRSESHIYLTWWIRAHGCHEPAAASLSPGCPSACLPQPARYRIVLRAPMQRSSPTVALPHYERGRSQRLQIRNQRGMHSKSIWLTVGTEYFHTQGNRVLSNFRSMSIQ